MNKFISLLLGAIFILTVMSMLGCITEKKCNAKFPPITETITNHTRETIIKDSILQGATVYNTIYKDSIAYYPAYQWRVIKDTSGMAELRIMKDAMGNIIAECVAKDRKVEKTHVSDSVDSSTVKTKVVVEKKMVWWGYLIIILLSLLLVRKYLGSFLKKFL